MLFVTDSPKCSPILSLVKLFSIFYFDAHSFDNIFFLPFMPIMKRRIA